MSIKNWFLDIEAGTDHRRRHLRVAAVNLIRIDTKGLPQGPLVLNITDLSECGIGFRTSVRLDPGEVYPVRLHTLRRDIAASVRIRWCAWIGGSERIYEIGAEFESLSEEDRPYLLELIQLHAKENS